MELTGFVTSTERPIGEQLNQSNHKETRGASWTTYHVLFLIGYVLKMDGLTVKMLVNAVGGEPVRDISLKFQ